MANIHIIDTGNNLKLLNDPCINIVTWEIELTLRHIPPKNAIFFYKLLYHSTISILNLLDSYFETFLMYKEKKTRTNNRELELNLPERI